MAISLKNHEDRITVLENKAASAGSLGVNQKWYNMTSSRALDNVYTNNTGKPIYVLIASQVGTWYESNIYVDNLPVSHMIKRIEGTISVSLSTIVPNGSSYKYTSNSALERWYELR